MSWGGAFKRSLKSGKTYESPGIRYLLLALDTIWLGAIAVHATDDASAIGLWKGQDATFEMFESEGKLSAQIVALSEPNTSEGKEKTDVHNPDPTKRNHPIIGLVFYMWLWKKSDTRWENGTIYDLKGGKTYSCLMDLAVTRHSSRSAVLLVSY